MTRIIYLAGLAALCAGELFAQSPLNAQRMTAPLRNAGIYHLATGTWTRSAGATANLGPDVIYTNTADSSYFTTAGMADATGDWSWIDEGRVPSPNSDVVGAEYIDAQVNGLSFSYCTDAATPIGLTFQAYESYGPCDLVRTDPSAIFTLSGALTATGLPASPMGGNSCWTVTLDLTGAAEFTLEAEGGDQYPGHDGDVALDSFGLEWIFNGTAGTETGPVLAGDPTWTATVAGALLHGGTGTYYSTIGSCSDTGLDTRDLVAADQATTGISGGPGCYFFGGYDNPSNGCGGPSKFAFASFATTIYAVSGECLTSCLPNFCEPAGANSSGNAASLSFEGTAAGAGIRLVASGGPQLASTGFGYFLVSSSTTQGLPIGDGVLCLGQPQGRYAPGGAAALNSLGKFDANGDFENLSGTSTSGYGFDVPTQLPSPPGGSIQPGSTWHFQLWYRDLNPGPTVNFSNGITSEF